ncbi:MAG TPA: DPP IV N-terminal domain-containing protein, partial [Blastocatellia bacterium]|nr:DPP IV N-terminal domain-containing protein [Blastocatellia bacterium]
GTAIYYEWNFHFYRLDLNTKEAVSLLPPNPHFRFPQDFALSLDQKEVAFIAQENRQYDIWRLPLGGGAPQRVTHDSVFEQAPFWQPDNKLLYNVRHEGAMQVYWLDVTSGVSTLIPTGDHPCHLADYSVATGRLLCQEQRDESDVFSVPTEGGAEREVTNDLGAEFWATIAPNNSAVLYHSIPGERFIWEPRKSFLFSRSLTDKGTVARLAADAFEAQWSPSGERIAFLRMTDQITRQLWVINAAGGEERQLTNGDVVISGVRNSPPYNRSQPSAWSWSPDSQRLAYCVTQDGAVNVWTVAADGTQATPVSANRDPDIRFDCPLWSPDGQRLAYITETGRKGAPGKPTRSLWVTQQEKSRLVFQTEALLRFLGWTTNHELIVALTDSLTGSRTQPTSVQLVVLKLNAADTVDQRPLGTLSETYLSNVHLAANGQRIAFVKSQNGRDDIWLFSPGNGQQRKLTNNSDPSALFASLSWAPDGKTIYYDKQARWSILTMTTLGQ